MNSVTADVLYQMYIVEGKTMKAISEELHIATGKIHRLIHEYGIPAKKLSDYPATDKQRAAWSKIGKSRKGVSLTPEHREKISEAMKIHAAGHIKTRSDGYKALYYPDYPRSNKEGYVMEHIYIMEQHIGRPLKENECVHHINFIRDDNRIENLKLMTKSEHMSYHMRLRYAKERSDVLSIVSF
jgi:hypothetical protein